MYDIINNPIPRSGLFATKSLAEIQEFIECFPAKQKAELYMVMQFTLNACNKIVEDEILSKEVFAQ
jgi:hypothetical protein